MRLRSFQEFTQTKYPKYLCSPLFHHYRTGSYPPTSKVLENPWFLNSASSATGAPGNTASSRSSSMRDLSALRQRGEAELAGCNVFLVTSILSYRFHCISWNIVEYHEKYHQISTNIRYQQIMSALGLNLTRQPPRFPSIPWCLLRCPQVSLLIGLEINFDGLLADFASSRLDGVVEIVGLRFAELVICGKNLGSLGALGDQRCESISMNHPMIGVPNFWPIADMVFDLGSSSEAEMEIKSTEDKKAESISKIIKISAIIVSKSCEMLRISVQTSWDAKSCGTPWIPPSITS